MNGSLMAAEIAEQPAVFRRVLCEGLPEIRRVARSIQAVQPRFVLFVARGTSDHAALYAKYLFEIELGMPAGLASPSTVTVYGARPRLDDVLVIAISQSGASPDVVEPIVQARDSGATTLAITNSPSSPLALAAEHAIDILADAERAVAATKTYTAELLTLYLLADALKDGNAVDAANLPEWAKSVLAMEDAVAELAVRYRFVEQLVITARGFEYATAREAALKFMETSYVVAHAFSGADLLHGPLAMIDRGFPVIALLPPGRSAVALQPVLERLRERGADTLVVGDPEFSQLGTIALPLPISCPEALSPLLTILPMQQFALHLARQRGLDPDHPRGLKKVTETL